MDQIVIKEAGNGRVKIELPLTEEGNHRVVQDEVLHSLAATIFFTIQGIIRAQEAYSEKAD